jgi:hypothetical protein
VNAAIELAGGAAALGFAAGIATGQVRGVFRSELSESNSRLVRQLRNPSLRVAAAAGVATHLPGLLYLLGLNAIADGSPPLVEGLLAVLRRDLAGNPILCAGPQHPPPRGGQRRARPGISLDAES